MLATSHVTCDIISCSWTKSTYSFSAGLPFVLLAICMTVLVTLLV